MSKNIKVGITHGDCNGIGYEVIIKALNAEGITDLFTPVIFGSEKVMNFYIRNCGIDKFPYRRIRHAGEADGDHVYLVDINTGELKANPGQPSEEGGAAALAALEMAVEALHRGDIDVLVTAPIDKSTIHGEGFDFVGHTEYLESKLAGDGEKALMILHNDGLRVALVTTHVAVADIASHITAESISDTVRRLDKSLRRDFRTGRPRIAVLSLNPHCGDHGVAGDEDDTITRPTIEALRGEGIMAFGPYAADGFFGSGAYKRYDGVVAMYHDQGLAPFKALAGGNGVNYTAGLPFVRTSPDHGTGYDIAGRGEADPTSMRQAIYSAIDIFRSRRDYDRAGRNPLRPLPAEKKKEKRAADREESLPAEPDQPAND